MHEKAFLTGKGLFSSRSQVFKFGPKSFKTFSLHIIYPKTQSANMSQSQDFFYITTPLYYVNDRPHLGTAYSTVIADILSRLHKLFGRETFFLTGTDEHGQKCERAARKRGLSPEKHCQEMRQRFKEAWRQLNIAYTPIGAQDGSFFYTSHRYSSLLTGEPDRLAGGHHSAGLSETLAAGHDLGGQLKGASPQGHSPASERQSQSSKKLEQSGAHHTRLEQEPAPEKPEQEPAREKLEQEPARAKPEQSLARGDDHTSLVQKLLNRLKNQGDIYQADYKGWYCVSEEIFYTEKDLIDGKSPTGKEVIFLEEKAWFFKMSRFQKDLQRHIEDYPDFIRPAHKKNEIIGFLKKPLRDLCVSRPKSRVSWGIELPFDKSCVVYVWVDALLNYITGLGYGSQIKEERDQFEKYWHKAGALHLIGKDILMTHAVYWPCLLKALGLPLPKTIFAHGWLLNKEAEKMSKSQGAVLDPVELARDLGGADSLRWLLARDIPFGRDFPISKSLMIRRINEDLADGPGNILSRLARLAERHFEGRLPPPPGAGAYLQPLADKLCQSFRQKAENLALSEALRELSGFFDEINAFLEQKAPWKLVKTDKQAGGLVLAEALEALRIGGVLLFPIMPEKASVLLSPWIAQRKEQGPIKRETSLQDEKPPEAMEPKQGSGGGPETSSFADKDGVSWGDSSAKEEALLSLIDEDERKTGGEPNGPELSSVAEGGPIKESASKGDRPFYKEKGAFKWTAWGSCRLIHPVRHGAPLFPKIPPLK